jgi:hypothetical protein
MKALVDLKQAMKQTIIDGFLRHRIYDSIALVLNNQ